MSVANQYSAGRIDCSACYICLYTKLNIIKVFLVKVWENFSIYQSKTTNLITTSTTFITKLKYLETKNIQWLRILIKAFIKF